MTEYEAASLALQQASVWVAAIVGAAQCSLIGCGLYIMRQAAHHRDAQHRENMAQHRETMAVLDRQHRENMVTLNGQNEALRELIRRTSS